MLFGHLAKRRLLLTLLFLVLAVALLAPSAGVAGLARSATLTVASSQQSAPSSSSGNSGTIKISESPDYQPPAGQSNEPHVTCPFWVQGYGFPVGSGWLSVSVQAPAVPPQTVGQVIINNLPYTDTQQADGSFFNVPNNAVGFGAGDGFVSGGHYEVDVTDARNDKNKVFFT